MNEINFESKGEKLYVVKLDDTAIGRLLKNKEGSWKISLGVLDDQDLYSLLNSLNQEPCKCRAWERTMKNKRQPLYNKDEFCKLLGLPAKKFWQIKKNPFFPESRFLGKKEYWEKDKVLKFVRLVKLEIKLNQAIFQSNKLFSELTKLEKEISACPPILKTRTKGNKINFAINCERLLLIRRRQSLIDLYNKKFGDIMAVTEIGSYLIPDHLIEYVQKRNRRNRLCG